MSALNRKPQPKKGAANGIQPATAAAALVRTSAHALQAAKHMLPANSESRKELDRIQGDIGALAASLALEGWRSLKAAYYERQTG